MLRARRAGCPLQRGDSGHPAGKQRGACAGGAAVKLHPYQEIGVLHLRAHPRAGLFLDMGLGKTATTLRALTPAHLPALVVAPRRVVDLVWPTEMALWRPDLKLGRDIDVVSRDRLHRATDPGNYRTTILDAPSSFKNSSSHLRTLA